MKSKISYRIYRLFKNACGKCILGKDTSHSDEKFQKLEDTCAKHYLLLLFDVRVKLDNQTYSVADCSFTSTVKSQWGLNCLCIRLARLSYLTAISAASDRL